MLHTLLLALALVASPSLHAQDKESFSRDTKIVELYQAYLASTNTDEKLLEALTTLHGHRNSMQARQVMLDYQRLFIQSSKIRDLVYTDLKNNYRPDLTTKDVDNTIARIGNQFLQSGMTRIPKRLLIQQQALLGSAASKTTGPECKHVLGSAKDAKALGNAEARLTMALRDDEFVRYMEINAQALRAEISGFPAVNAVDPRKVAEARRVLKKKAENPKYATFWPEDMSNSSDQEACRLLVGIAKLIQEMDPVLSEQYLLSTMTSLKFASPSR